MKRALVVIVLVFVGLSCLIERHSDDFACETSADCAEFTDPTRTCEDGYCVKESCPSICDSCGSNKLCTINCNNPNECSNGITCPSGFACRIVCSRDCQPVTCTNALSCQVECGTNASCGPLNCGAASPCACTSAGGTCM